MITYKRIVETMPRIDAKEFSHSPLKYLQNAIRTQPNQISYDQRNVFEREYLSLVDNTKKNYNMVKVVLFYLM